MKLNRTEAILVLFYLPATVEQVEHPIELLKLVHAISEKDEEDVSFSTAFLWALLRAIPIESASLAKVYLELKQKIAYDILHKDFLDHCPRPREDELLIQSITGEVNKHFEEAKDGGTSEDSGKD